MAGYNLGSSESPKIFSDSSIRKYLRFSRLWILNMDSLLDTENLTEEYYYLGSYIFDVNGQKYEKDADGKPFNTEIWNNLHGERYDKVRGVFDPTYKKSEHVTLPVASADNSRKDDKSGVYSITQLIQLQYLSTHEKIVHLFRENDENICEILTRKNSESEIEYVYDSGECVFHYNGEPERDLPLSPIGGQHSSVIKEILDRHYDLIKESEGAHMYFVPRILKPLGKIINVTTVICPDSLDDGSIGVVQFGLDNASSGLIEDTVAYFNRIAMEEARKSAKAAIMSRNMSHNLGSHVMAYLKQHLSSVTSILQDNVLAELDVINDLVATKKIEDIALPFLVGVGHFVSYLQERQDFIATIATDYIPYFAEVNFKDAIYDELSPDKRFKRHPRMKNYLPDNILLGNIARSEGLGREIRTTAKDSGRLSDIELFFRHFNGDPVVDNNGNVLSGREDAWESLQEMRRIGVSLPGGVVGRQAVFSILENIIRNAAKHGNWRDQGKLELTIDFIDKNKVDEFAQKLEKLDGNSEALDELIGDDATPEHDSLMQVLWRYYSKAKDADDLYFVTITDNILVDASAVKNLRDVLYQPYIDPETKKMDEGNKGIKELRISAAWLRGAKNEEEYYRPNDKLDKLQEPQEDKKAPLLYARQHYGCLQYIFCLQKPRTVAIILDEKTYQNKKFKPGKNTPADNWRIYTTAAFFKENNKSFTFILCENQAVYDEVRPFSSARTYNMELVKSERGVDLNSLLFDVDVLDEKKCKSIELELYKLLVDAQCKDMISVEDGRAAANIYNEAKKDASYATTEITFEEVVENGQKQTRKITTNRIKGINVIVTDGSRPAKFIYRTHHDGANEFKDFMDKRAALYKDCRFVESITGNTSTDRLVRNERIDFKWYYSHLHAMKQRIAIFDERMFAKIYGLEEVNFTKGAIDPADLEKTKRAYLDAMSRDFTKSINETTSSADLNTYVIDRYDKFDKSKLAVSKAKTKDRMGLTYYQMGVSLFTLIREVSIEKENVYSIYGLFLERKPDGVFEPEYNNDDFSCVCAKLAELSWENQGLKVDYIDEIKEPQANFIKHAFDYISIHQGLLDKLYEAFGIKDKNFDKEKTALTNKLYKEFGCVGKMCREDGFVPGLTIHSGRSKPAENDMPQHLPFIQYAAIEHALMDCKYTLVNLLEDARYDKQ